MGQEQTEQSNDELYCPNCAHYLDIEDIDIAKFAGTCSGITYNCPVCGGNSAEFVPKNELPIIYSSMGALDSFLKNSDGCVGLVGGHTNTLPAPIVRGRNSKLDDFVEYV